MATVHYRRLRHAALFVASLSWLSESSVDMEAYAPKSCKYSPIPDNLNSRAYAVFTGEVRVHDVFGLPSTLKRHILQIDVKTQSLLTLQAEVGRDTPATLAVDAYRRGQVGNPSGRVLVGSSFLGAGGEDTKAFLHGLLGDKDLEIDVVFDLISVELAASQVDSRIAEARCWPVRLDVVTVPTSRAALHWPTSCGSQNYLPPGLQDGQVRVLGDEGLAAPLDPNRHYTYRFGDERPWNGFERSLWNSAIEVPSRMHRFVRFFMSVSFRFSSGPLQLAIELFDLKDAPDPTALSPKCLLGCLGGVPVYNGQVVDHAMPTGFKYKLWLLAAGLTEWTQVLPDAGKHCIEFDFEYSIRFEQRMTPFEIGASAWMCESSRLPQRLVQTSKPWPTDRLASADHLVAGRSIWIRDRFGFPPEEVSDMEHIIEVEVSEPSVFRATTHHSDGVDVFIALSRKGETERVCKTLKHPGQVPRQTIFCILQPGTYRLTFFAEFPLGGLHPCSDFFAQVGVRPVAFGSEDKTKQCVSSASDLTALEVKKSLALTTTPRWTSIKVPITFDTSPSLVTVWSHSVTISEDDALQRLYLRLVVHSDYVSSDLRFQVKFEGRYVADTQVTSHGYADMIGPLDAGTYYVTMYYASGSGGAAGQKLCSTSMVDLRLVSRSSYGGGNMTAQWLCTSTRVPPPDSLTPQADEQVLLDSEYVLPSSGSHSIRLKFDDPRLVRVKATSENADFTLELWSKGAAEALVARGSDALEVFVGKGTFVLKMSASVPDLSSGGACPTFVLTMLLVHQQALPQCPWSPSSSDQTAAAIAQRNAADHIGSVSLDLAAKELSKTFEATKPVTLWMSQGMEKSFDMPLSTTSSVRIEVSVLPPFLPLSIVLRRKRDSGKLEPPIATADWTESRLLLMQSDLPRGTYILQIQQPRKYTIQPGSSLSEDSFANLCAHVTIHADVGVASKEAVNTMRAELLDLPALLAVQRFPKSFNTVGWFSSSLLPVVGTQVYNFPEGAAKGTLKLEDRAVIRVVCEPADMSNANIEAVLMQNGAAVTRSDALGQLVAELQPGVYEISMQPQGKAPFLVTLGFATHSRIKEDFALQDSGKECLGKFPALASGMTFPARGWSIGPSVIRLKPSFLGADGVLSKVPVVLKVASIIYIEAGSALPLDLVRIALQVPEGLWVGEQRGLRNSLELELPPGEYSVHIAQPLPLRTEQQLAPNRCLEFSVRITATPVSPDAATDAAEASGATAAADGGAAAAASATGAGGAGSAGQAGGRQELAPREEATVQAAPCFAMGTVPLPLDFSEPTGGSRIMGGPLDAKEGRLLVRTHAMMTDMHNGRKKVFLSTGGKKLQMKIGVMLGNHARLSLASHLTFVVQPIDGAAAIDPVETWSTPGGWERIYNLDGAGYWLIFHHGHRERAESACLHFGLEIEAHPVEDMQRMIACPGSSSNPEDLFPNSFDVSSDSKVYRYVKPMAFLQQVQRGFLTTTRFTLSRESYVSAEVGFNFFASHAEMDIIRQGSEVPIATAETEFLHEPTDVLNTQLFIGRKLPAGDYALRVADDHYQKQVGDGSGCFPFSVEFRVVPAKASPMVVSILPHPSVPVPRGVDLVLTIRFSEPPKGTIEEVVSCISFGGVRATTGGSMHAMSSQYASSTTRTSTVQASTAEDHLVWVIGWSAEALRSMDEAKLRIIGLTSNATGLKFRLSSPVYSIVDAPKGLPWNGGTPSKASSSSAAAGAGEDRGGSRAVDGGVGKASPEGGSASSASRTDETVGKPRSESGSAAALPDAERAGEVRTEDGAAAVSRGQGVGSVSSEGGGRSADADEDNDDMEDHRPRVQEWNPIDQPSKPRRGDDGKAEPSRPSGRQDYSPLDDGADDCPSGTVRSASTGLCEGGSAMPVGYRTITMGCVVVVAVLYFWPNLRRLAAPDPRSAKGRFRDIGERTSEEEMGLVGAKDFVEDDDML